MLNTLRQQERCSSATNSAWALGVSVGRLERRTVGLLQRRRQLLQFRPQLHHPLDQEPSCLDLLFWRPSQRGGPMPVNVHSLYAVWQLKQGDPLSQRIWTLGQHHAAWREG